MKAEPAPGTHSLSRVPEGTRDVPTGGRVGRKFQVGSWTPSKPVHWQLLPLGGPGLLTGRGGLSLAMGASELRPQSTRAMSDKLRIDCLAAKQ